MMKTKGLHGEAMMKRRKIRQRGYALITAMAIGVVGLTITSVVMLRMMNSTSQITQREHEDQATFLAESVANHIVDKIADLTAEPDVDGEGTPGISLTAQDLVQRLHASGEDFLASDVNTAGGMVFSRPVSLPSGKVEQQYNPGAENVAPFLNELMTNAQHSEEFWTKFQAESDHSGIADTLDALHANFYSVYHVKKGAGQADIQISVIPLATDVKGTSEEDLHDPETLVKHHDVLKIQVTAFVPSMNNPRTTKTLDIIVNRPVIPIRSNSFDLTHSILADGSISMQNWNTSAGVTSGSAVALDDEHRGDIHSNDSISVGSNGVIRGRATAVNNVSLSGTVLPSSDFQEDTGDIRDTTAVTDKIYLNDNGTSKGAANENARESRSGADKLDLPEVKDDALPTVECSSASNPRVYKDCYITSLPNADIIFEGTVHVRGDISNNTKKHSCKGDTPCRVVVDGTYSQIGNGSTSDNSEQPMLVMIRNQNNASTCATVGGNFSSTSGHGVLLYVDDPNCETKMMGNTNFFGSIITKGSFSGNGNATNFGVQRAVNDNFSLWFKPKPPTPPSKPELFPTIISWKAKRAN